MAELDWLFDSDSPTIQTGTAGMSGLFDLPDESPDFEAVFQQMLGQLPGAVERTQPIGDVASTLADQGMVRLPSGEVQDLGAFRRSALRDFQKQLLGRDPRGQRTVEMDGVKFIWDAKAGQARPLQRVVTDVGLTEPAPVAGGLIDQQELKGLSAAEVEQLRLNRARGVASRGVRIRGETPDVSADLQARATAALREQAETEATRMPLNLENALLGAASKLQPGDDPTAILQAALQRSQRERTTAETKRLKQAFNMALQRMGLEERKIAREERQEDRQFARRVANERRMFSRVQTVHNRIVTKAEQLQRMVENGQIVDDRAQRILGDYADGLAKGLPNDEHRNTLAGMGAWVPEDVITAPDVTAPMDDTGFNKPSPVLDVAMQQAQQLAKFTPDQGIKTLFGGRDLQAIEAGERADEVILMLIDELQQLRERPEQFNQRAANFAHGDPFTTVLGFRRRAVLEGNIATLMGKLTSKGMDTEAAGQVVGATIQEALKQWVSARRATERTEPPENATARAR